MLTGIDIFALQDEDEIFEIYKELNKNLLKYNNAFFHFNENNLKKYIRCPNNSPVLRFNKFKRNWENFNIHKQSLNHFFKHNNIDYPSCFSISSRICIKEIELNYEDILEEINVLKINRQSINYTYKQIIYKLVKSIIIKHILNNNNLLVLDVDLIENKIHLEYLELKNNNTIEKDYKLNKFLQKYQKIYPDEYKNINAWLIVSNNWQDIFLSSTFKQWVSCMNLIRNL